MDDLLARPWLLVYVGICLGLGMAVARGALEFLFEAVPTFWREFRRAYHAGRRRATPMVDRVRPPRTDVPERDPNFGVRPDLVERERDRSLRVVIPLEDDEDRR